MISVSEAVARLIQTTSTVKEEEEVSLSQALDRILSEDVRSNFYVPPQDNSAMDGYAVHTDALQTVPTILDVTQTIAAGDATKPLQAGTAARIFTGAEIPPGANTVVMQENCEQIAQDNKVEILQLPYPGENIRRKGQDIRQHATILSAGKKITAQDIGVLAAIGKANVKVRRKPRIAIISTGDELISADNQSSLPPGKIFNSNLPMLEALVQKANGELVHQHHISDDFGSISETLQTCCENVDLIISSGGVSVGDKDFVKQAVQEIGNLDFWKVKLKPGKPIAIGKIAQAHFLGLPGNPVSSFVTFLLFALPLIQKLQGRNDHPSKSYKAKSLFVIDKPRTRPEYLRVRQTPHGVEQFENQSSGVLSSLVWADALALIPEETIIRQGDEVEVFPLNLFFE